MNNEELKEAYYKLALAELHYRFTNNKGRPFNEAKYFELARLICLEDYSLYKACNVTGLIQSEIYRKKFRFIGARSITTANQGNRERKLYNKSFKENIIKRLESGSSYVGLQRETGVTYTTLRNWVLLHKAGMLN